MCLWMISLSWCNQLEIAMKRYFGVVAAAALLAGTVAVATDGLAAGHGRGGFGGGHIGGGFRGPLLDSVPSNPPPVFNPSSPYTVAPSRETPARRQVPDGYLGMTEAIRPALVSLELNQRICIESPKSDVERGSRIQWNFCVGLPRDRISSA
jgi:hypothetical protein